MSDLDPRRHAPATLRNREAILAVLRAELPAQGLLLEVASGTGEHAAFMAPRLPSALVWQPSDADPDALAGIDAHAAAVAGSNLRPAIRLDAAEADWPVARPDAILAVNLVHIAPWRVAEGLFAAAGRLLPPGGPLILYGPFKRHGRHTVPSNAAFDRGLRAQHGAWGVRCLDTDFAPLTRANALGPPTIHQMPANNLTVVWRKIGLMQRA